MSESVFYVGTYTQVLPHVKGAAEGIYAYRLDAATGAIERIHTAAGVTNPSFVALHPSRPLLLAVQELGEYNGQPGGAVSSFAVDTQTSALTLLSHQPTHGAHPCYVSVDATGRWVLVANYSGGNITVLPLGEDGQLGAATHVVAHEGISTHHNGAHPHSIRQEQGGWVLVPDCGLDRLAIYQLDAQRGTLRPHDPPWAQLYPGAGPRHFALSADAHYVYCINELGSSVTVFTYQAEAGQLHEIQTLSTLPDDFGGSNSCADIHIHPTGRWLYGSNRGHDSIVVFEIDPGDGMLTLIEHEPTHGRTPRNFAIDPTGSWLLAANQDSSTIVSFAIDPSTGMLSQRQIAEVPTPVCVMFR